MGFTGKKLLLHLDDVVVISQDIDSHFQRLEDVFKWLQSAVLKLKLTKLKLLQNEARYLSQVVSVATDPAKVETTQKWTSPKDVKTLQDVLGTAGHYRQCLPDFATVAKPLK